MTTLAEPPRRAKSFHSGPMRRARLRQGFHSARAYVDRMIEVLWLYVIENYDPDDHEGKFIELYLRPFLAKVVIDNYILSDERKWEMWVDSACVPKPKQRIWYVVGDVGAGKTAIAQDFAHGVHKRTRRMVVMCGEPSSTPDFIRPVPSIHEAPVGSIVLLDEAALNAAARDAMTTDGRLNPAFVALIRQNDLILIVISQNSKLGDSVFLIMAQGFVFKTPGLMQGATERGPLRKILKYYREMMPTIESETFVYARGIRLRFSRENPSFFTRDNSHAYRRIAPSDKDEALSVAMRLRLPPRPKSYKQISKIMTQRWQFRSDKWWAREIKNANGGVDPGAEVLAAAKKKD